jgi:Activator of Hsp90 ATPase homolog 1-like protein
MFKFVIISLFFDPLVSGPHRFNSAFFCERSNMPQAHAIQHEIAVRADPSKVHNAVATRDGLRGWNTSHVAGTGSVGTEWVLSYPGRPEFAWRVDRSDDHGVVWTCIRGPGDSVGTTVEYALTSLPDGRTRISLTHAGWPHQQGNFTKCNTLWGALLFHLKTFVESDIPAPALS